MALHTVVVPDALCLRVDWLTRNHVQTDNVSLGKLLLQGNNDILGVKPAVLGKHLWDNQEGLGEGNDSHAGLAINGVVVLEKVGRAAQLKSSSTRDNRLVLNGVLHSTQTIPDSVMDLLDGVLVGT